VLEGIFLIEVTDGLISHLYAVRNPDKLTTLEVLREIGR
jgi:RNA polymerase sigma-70 factor, ECF subfamily